MFACEKTSRIAAFSGKSQGLTGDGMNLQRHHDTLLNKQMKIHTSISSELKAQHHGNSESGDRRSPQCRKKLAAELAG